MAELRFLNVWIISAPDLAVAYRVAEAEGLKDLRWLVKGRLFAYTRPDGCRMFVRKSWLSSFKPQPTSAPPS